MTPAPPLSRTQLWLFYAFGIVTIGAALLAFKTNTTFILAIPALILVILFSILDYRSIYFLLLAMLPCSIEYYFPSGLATDLPTEPLMVGLMLVTFGLVFFRYSLLPIGFLSHPLWLLLMLHLFWIFICALNSGMPVFSFKVFLAKIWYILPFTVLTGIVIRKGDDLKKLIWCIGVPLTILIFISVMRHGIIYKFGFQEVNKSVTPYFRNHVNYAAMMSIFFPFLILALYWYERGTAMRRWIVGVIVFYIIAVYLSYTRTAMLAIVGMIPFYYIIKWRVLRLSLVSLIVVATIGLGWLFYYNHYLRFAPEFETTIYHDDFSTHVSSTFEGKDVSSMERVYRWVAAVRMSKDRPYMGVGSGNFANYYKSYTVNYFETYISDNEERSTVHNYFLLMLVEQGWPGLCIFLFLVFAIFLYGERAYRRMDNEEDRRAVMTLLVVMFSIIINLTLSDMLETDKVGPFFFLMIGLIVLFDLKAVSFKPLSSS